MTGVEFREVMTGQITLGAADPWAGYRGSASVGVILNATVTIDSVKAFLADPRHPGVLTVDFVAPRWGEQIAGGTGQFGLFVPSGQARTTHMLYELPVVIDGRRYWLRGVKYVTVSGIWRMWSATTTLLTTVHAGDDNTGAVVGAGVLRLDLPGLFSMLGTMRGANGRWSNRVWAVARFLAFFAGGLFSTYVLRRPA